MLRGGRDDDTPENKGRLGPIPERGIHVLSGIRMIIFGLVCLGAAAFTLTQI